MKLYSPNARWLSGLPSLRRLRSEEGFGLMELLISIVFLAVAMAAIANIFVSAFTATANGERRAAAGFLADQQMEIYRRLPYSQIRLAASNSLNDAGGSYGDLAAIPSGDIYQTSETGTLGFPSSGSRWVRDTDTASGETACPTGASEPPECMPVHVLSAAVTPDKHPYRLDTYIWSHLGTSNTACIPLATDTTCVKEVLVVVREYRANQLGKILAMTDSLFDPIQSPQTTTT